MTASAGTLGFRGFFWTCFSKALHSSYGIVGAISLILTIVGGFVEQLAPVTSPGWKFLAWFGPLVLGLVLLVPVLFRVAYELYQDESRLRNAYEQATELRARNRKIKDMLGRFILEMDRLIEDFVDPKKAPADPELAAFAVLAQAHDYLQENIGTHYSMRLVRIMDIRRNTTLKNQWAPYMMHQGVQELTAMISEIPD